MVTVRRFPLVRHLRAEPNEYILHHRRGRIAREGAGQSYWFAPLNAAITHVPTEDLEATFILDERTVDFQDLHVVVTIDYRIVDPEAASRRVDFGVSLDTGAWLEDPVERLSGLWAQRAQEPARRCLEGVTLVEALRAGPTVIRRAVEEGLLADEDLALMGLRLVQVQVTRVSTKPEVEKSLQTPARESMREKADEAVFRRRALAVENERAIQENELQTRIKLETQRERLIEKESTNRQLEVETEAASERYRTEAEVERERLRVEGTSEGRVVAARAHAESHRLTAESQAEGERQRLEAWEGASSRVLLGMALQEFAKNIENIHHLNVTPNMLGDAFKELLTEGKAT